MEIKQPEKAKNLNLAEMLNVSNDECITEFDKENGTLSVSFDKHTVQVPQILAAVMDVVEVSDIQVKETELSQIVKEIYHHGVQEV